MKRRRGNKKGRAKKPKLVSATEVASNVVSLNTEVNSGADEFDNEEVDSGMDAEAETTPSPPVTSQPETRGNADSVGRPINNIFGKAVYTRVKVKIKTSKNLDSQRTSSDAPSQSDTDKSIQQVGSEKRGLPNEKMEDSANSLSETNGLVSGNISRKSVGIKIKSRGLGSSSMSPCSNTEPVKGDRIEKKDTESLHQESIYNEQELKAALEVIRKVMKMDAAEPFNAPVNPVALGIPDYFDVIDTPMDFGTICSNLEKGVKYKNSEDVFNDVQYIWNNCYKYNNKGDYIVELMKRVKKNFTKYWTAVGLFNDQSQENNGSEGNPVKDPTPSSEADTPVNGGALNLSSKKFHGLKKHKEGCQCAICVMMRRRQEREEIAHLMGGTEGSDDSLGEDIKPEKNKFQNARISDRNLRMICIIWHHILGQVAPFPMRFGKKCLNRTMMEALQLTNRGPRSHWIRIRERKCWKIFVIWRIRCFWSYMEPSLQTILCLSGMDLIHWLVVTTKVPTVGVLSIQLFLH